MKRTPIKRTSDKMRAQLREEKKLSENLYHKQEGLCSCGQKLGWGSAKHEIISRARGGDPLDEDNCVFLCLECHMEAEGIRVAKEEVKHV